MDSTQPEFWSSRYASGQIPWDLGGIPTPLKTFLQRSSGSGRVLVPGCGSGYEIKAFHEAGYDVVGIDFSTAAVERAKNILGELAEKVILGDFFTHPFRMDFDFVYERTFLCSMPPKCWPDYVNRVTELLSANGKLIGIFLYGERATSGPPFAITDAEANRLLSRTFRLVRSETVSDSLPISRNKERWQEWQKF